jgi:ABC-type transport system involved in cytochrome c biogenesis permease subunit
VSPERTVSDRFQSYYEWELAISERRPGGTRVEHVVPWDRLDGLEGSTLVASGEGLPFDVEVSGWARNARPRRASVPGDGVNGWVIEALDPEREAEQNAPMAQVALRTRQGRGTPTGLVWGRELAPWAVEVSGRVFEVGLRHRSWALPFSIRLRRFVHERHPGTGMDSEFSSYVTKLEGGVERDVHITMNQPLRHRGYTFYQSGWGPAAGPPGAPRWSTFAVVRNPSDRVPIWACVVIALGLLFHFVQKLVRHLDSAGAAARRARAPGTPVAARATALGALAALALAAPASAADARPAKWTEATLEAAALVPLQEGGRIMPLDSYAGFTLLRLNHRRRAADEAGDRLAPMEWLLDVVFRPERARKYPCFLVEDSQVLDAAGLGHEGKKRRDRYSFEDLAPARARLAELARKYRRVETRLRSSVEEGVLNLSNDVEAFDRLARLLDFARPEIPVPESDRVRALWPGRDRVSALDVLDRVGELGAMMPSDPHAGVAGAPSAEGALDEDGKAAAELRARAIVALEAATELSLIPPPGAKDAEPTWLSPGHAVFAAATGGGVGAAQADLVRRLVSLARSADDAAAFEREMKGYSDRAVDLARGRGEYEKVPLEVSLTRLDPFYRSIYLYLLAFVALAISWARPSPWLVRAGWALMLGGAALHLTGIVVRSVLRGRPPISTLYDTTLVIAWIGVAGLLVAEAMHRRRVALGLAPVLGALLLFVGQRFEALKGEDTLPQLQAVLDTNFWLAVHVTCITTGYAGGLLASGVAHVHLLGRVAGVKSDDAGFYTLLHRMTYGMLCFGLLFSVVGTILGGIWANESWGRFWGWDPKENGALLICISQLAILHARMGGLLRPFGVAVGAVLSGCVVAFSWWGVNLLGIGLHSYGFTGGILRGLTIFYVAEAIVLGAAAAAHWTGRSYGARTPPAT